jgi:hypothetical protein
VLARPFSSIEKKVRMTGGRAREPFSRCIGRLSSSATSTQSARTSRTTRQHTGGVPIQQPPLNSEMNTMSDIRESRPAEEPMGIVISQGSRAESTPRFAAYVWSQAGDVAAVVAEPRAA